MARLVAAAIAIISAYWVFTGLFIYEFWEEHTPGSGFLAVVIGSLTLVLSVIELFKGTKTDFKLERKYFYPMIAAIILVVSLKVFGLLLSCGLFILLWLKFFEKYTFKRSIIYGLSTTIVIYVLFIMFLDVPFPVGVLGI